MNLARRQEYLSAMGIELWTLRAVPGAAPASLAEHIVIGPGDGNTLLVCGGPDEAATALAADIARCLEGEPVWSWPARTDSGPGIPLTQAIEEHLFTRVLVLGRGLVASAGDPGAAVLGSAHLIVADSIETLLANSAARRGLWLALSANLWCAGSA